MHDPLGRRARVGLLLPLLLVAVPGFVVPLFLMLQTSLSTAGGISGSGAYGVANFAAVLGDEFYVGILLDTVRLGVLATVAALVIGWPFAYFTSFHAGRWGPLLLWFVMIPLIVSVIVRAYGFMAIIGDSGLVNRVLLAAGVVDEPIPMLFSTTGSFIGLLHRYLPLMILPIYASLNRIEPALLRGSASLGGTDRDAFRRVALPLSMPGTIVGIQLFFAGVISDVVMPLLLGGSGARLLAPTILDQATNRLDFPLASAMATILMAATLGLLAVVAVLGRRATPWLRAGRS